MKKQIIFIVVIIALVVVIILFMIKIGGQFTQDAEDQDKMRKVDHLFSTWMTIASPADKQSLKDREPAIKNEIYTTLSTEEIEFLDEYSGNIAVLKNERSAISPVSIAMVGYLTQNFSRVKQIASKTSLGEFMNKFKIK